MEVPQMANSNGVRRMSARLQIVGLIVMTGALYSACRTLVFTDVSHPERSHAAYSVKASTSPFM